MSSLVLLLNPVKRVHSQRNVACRSGILWMFASQRSSTSRKITWSSCVFLNKPVILFTTVIPYVISILETSNISL